MFAPVWPAPAPASIVGQRLSRAAATEDIDFLLATYDDVHPDLYANVSRDSVRRLRDEFVRRLPDSVSRIELWLGLDRIATAFGDGHTTLSPPRDEIIQAVVRGDMLLPVGVVLDETGRLVVGTTPVGDTTLRRGDRLVSVNGRSADSLLEEIAGEMSGESPVWRERQAASGFAGHLWLLGVRAPFAVRTRSASGVERGESFPVRPPDLAAAKAADRAAAAAPRLGFRYQLLRNKVGYLDFFAMNADLSVFRAEIAKTFARLAADSAAELVIDLRRNGGGNSVLGDALLNHFNDRPYRQESRKDWRMSRQYRAFLMSGVPGPVRWFRLAYLSSTGRRLLSAPEGGIVTFTDAVHPAGHAEPFFRGPVCILIGPGTFSSATDLAAAVKDFRLATLIGEETGGRATSFGEVYPFELPHSRLEAGVSSASFVRPNGDASDRRGVLPDIEVRSTAADVGAGRDPVLDRARECPARPA